MLNFNNKLKMAATLLRTIGEEALAVQRAKSAWINSFYTAIDELKPDYSGKVGERFLWGVCKATGLDHVYVDDDKNSKDGTYDITILGRKIEVKTARLGVQGGFQHENLHASGYDFYAFVDVKPDEFFVTVIQKFDMTARHPVLGRKPHLRKGTSDVFKFDWSESNLRRSIQAGLTLRVGPDAPLEAIGEFLRARIAPE